ncbi:hypothetical protein NADFUDRAFT_50957 [Nadsonia fulvescens var. elongata DSM 6958]|uniref:Uncharacterized protein n=1 Tax=Nadsonia fulvescens var. elongata DSM 6958 TaxID=857566 RepID=A0A1E3PJR3_9ASCO|nr:hypothetical protein NADFUDRAFT_50957 [Nadsonia fulvescens var. elongata DSM 6958]
MFKSILDIPRVSPEQRQIIMKKLDHIKSKTNALSVLSDTNRILSLVQRSWMSNNQSFSVANSMEQMLLNQNQPVLTNNLPNNDGDPSNKSPLYLIFNQDG